MCFATVLARWIVFLWVSTLALVLFVHRGFTTWYLPFLVISNLLMLGWRAPSTIRSCLICLCCFWACKAFNNFAKVILDRSFVFSKVVVDVSYLSGCYKNFFYNFWIREFTSNNLTLLTITSNLFEDSLIVSDSFILCNSNFLIKFSTCKPHILLSPAYSSFW